jgi:hypothetical protein
MTNFRMSLRCATNANGVRRLRDLFRTPVNLLGFSPKRHAMIGLFLADSDLNSLFALPRNQLKEVAQLRVALPSFRSSGCKYFAGGFPALDFPDSHFEIPYYFRDLSANQGAAFGRSAQSPSPGRTRSNQPRSGGERSDSHSSPKSSGRHRQIKHFDLQLTDI